ncbi:TetR/AcrR family transcriptional regulator [Sphingomonas sp. 1P08PE]|uniref:TetR/AcrR family transcriptional regulator n=1 Tax=Sphingomonas sp. 1P08PE TaxID=554122 RepID=UPI0039A310B9
MTGVPDPKGRRAPRRDAQERREALIVAAAACFASDGYGVPLEVVAERAGVGRGTLYRNFPDREALALAIFSREVDRLEAALDPTASIAGTIAAMVRMGAPAVSLFARIAAELHHGDSNLTAFRAIGERLERVVAPAVGQAQARGEIDDRITPRDVVMAMRMAGGLLLPFMDEDEVTDQLAAAMSLLFEGLRPR